MASTFTMTRAHLIYGLCLPLALLLGYLLAEPLESSSLAVVVLVLSLLITPLLMRWYHPLLILCWNSAFYFPFMPGAPPAWVVVMVLGALFMVLNRCVDPNRRLWVGGSVPWALVSFGVVVIVTAVVTGGVGLRVLGSSTYGGRKYIFVAAGILAYFVMTTQRVPKARAMLFASIFFLSGATTLIGDIGSRLGIDAVFYFVSPDSADAASAGYDVSNSTMIRRTGWVSLASAFCLFFLARYGVKGLLDLSRPWRLGLTIFFLALGLYGGFRSFIGFLLLVFALVFFLEGLHRTRYLLVAILSTSLCLVGLTALATKLPLSVQRSLSFLPIPVSPAAASAAQGTLDWRFDMWKEVVHDVPRYFFKGKGYVIDPGELFFSRINNGFELPSEWAIVAGDYHNGPLSVLIPFGVWGALAFGWFICASLRLLSRYCKYGDPALGTINRTLLACFIARTVFFVFLVGGVSADLPYFVSLIGLAVCLNGKEPSPPKVETDKEVIEREAFQRVSFGREVF